jgi:DNA invertase Pin-like site-specific DNA recombinase
MATQLSAPELVVPGAEVVEVTPPQAATVAQLEQAGVLPRGFEQLERARDESPLRRRAAEYVRMSTEHQQYSTACQHDAIVSYARAHGLEIVRTYSDEARSGLTLHGREALRAMLADVVAGTADFGTILVYDVSRWGRFQDPDESAYYEFLCRREGVRVEYCAEPFRNDGSATSSLIKNIKRMMAGEFSRELGVKVSAAKMKISRRGFHVGGEAPYGLRRVVVDSCGRQRAVLQLGETKVSSLDRVVLAPGPAEEVRVVKWLFRQVATKGTKPMALARELNLRGVPYKGGRDWRPLTISTMLANEKYIGNLVYGAHSVTLRGPPVARPFDEQVRVERAYRATVDSKVYRRAQEVMSLWASRIDNDSALAELRKVLDRNGKLTTELIDTTPGVPGTDFYRARFGSLPRAYSLVGFRVNRDYEWTKEYGVRERLLAAFRDRVGTELVQRGVSVVPESGVVSVVGGRLRLGALLAQRRLWKGVPYWLAQAHVEPQPHWYVIARLDAAMPSIMGYTLIRGGLQGIWIGARHRNTEHRERSEPNLEPLLDAVVECLSGPLEPPIPERRARRVVQSRPCAP